MRLLRPLLVLAGVLLMAGCQTSLVGPNSGGAPNSGISDLQLSIKPTTLNFGNTTVGSTAVLNVSITNDGTHTVTVAQGAVSGGSAFSTTGIGAGVVLVAHQTAVLDVQFRPTTNGSSSGSVTLTSSASGRAGGPGGAVTITLSGQGVAPGHSVTLTWGAEPGVLGYNVYRRSSGSDPWVKLNSSPVATNAYTDSTVQSGQLYSYAVSAIGSDGLESGLSEIVTVLIPSP
jgi:hypothetical protein